MRGSPPRVRGKVSQKTGFALTTRITPACAGKSPPNLMSQFPTPDHPRVCGEKKQAALSDDDQMGSPPRVRGKVNADLAAFFTLRITPACAGKRLIWFHLEPAAKDHPRVCGEKLVSIFKLFKTVGSPPRVRGKVFYHTFNEFLLGITPACAGKRKTIKANTYRH